MRIRSVKPEFWRSQDIAGLRWETRLLFIGLWSYVDDNGVGRDVEQLITADLFALEDDPSEARVRVHGGLTELSNAGLIVRYEVEGRPFLAIPTWKTHQKINRPSPARYPGPDRGNSSIHDALTESSVSAHASEQGIREQGNRGTGEKNPPAPAVLESEFDRAWQHWPKKVERKAALAKFKTATKRIPVDELVAAIIRYGDAYAATTERKFVPALDAWLNGDRWNDELPQAWAAPVRLTAAQRNLSVVAQFEALKVQGTPRMLEAP